MYVGLFVQKSGKNKKLSYPQRKRASNMAVLYGADGISLWNRLGMDHESDSTAVPSVESIQNASSKFAELAQLSTAFDLSLTHWFGVNP